MDFFKDVLGRLLPSAEFVDGAGFATTCVTCKSRSGERLLAELAPGLIQQTGCNGGGATAAVAWGAEVADEATWAAIAELYALPVRRSGMTFFQEAIPLTVGKDEASAP